MKNTKFLNALKSGLGGAIIQIKNSNNRDEYRDAVLWCCLHDTCYDTQSEGNRSEYLYEAIGLFDDKEYFETAIIRKYNQERITNDWLFSQLNNLIYQFAVDSSENSKLTLYKKYEYLYSRLVSMHKYQGDCINAFETLCIKLISLDGFNAFQKIITMIGLQITSAASDVFCLDWFYENARDLFGKKRVDHYLQSQAARSEGIALFFNAVKKVHDFNREEQPIPTLEKYIESMAETDPSFSKRYYAYKFAKVATQEELLIIAQAAVAEQDCFIKVDLMNVFLHKAFPLDEKHILELTENEDETIRDAGFEMLQQIKSPIVRNYAIKLLKEGKETSNAISVLCKNFQKEDEILLYKSIKKLPITHHGVWHACFDDVEKLYRHRRLKPKTGILTYMYYNTLCSFCREYIVRTMHKKGVLTQGILQECLYDSNSYIRSFASHILKKQCSAK